MYEIDEALKWCDLTRLMIKNFPLILIVQRVYDLAEEVANNEYKNFVPPDLSGGVSCSYDKIRPTKSKIDPNAILLKDKIRITDIAKKYGLKVRGNMAICPFHNDTDPSLSLSDEKGVFNCFGCGVKGDIITLVKMLEELKNA